jgi:DNA-binding IclR family transcriptional regulator
VPAKKDENWLSLVKSHLEDLRALTGLSASLSMPSGKDMIYVLQILGREGLAVNNPPGTRRPVHCTAVGKAYLG